MKRLFTFVICLALSHLSNAAFLTSNFAVDSGSAVGANTRTASAPAANQQGYLAFQNASFQSRLDAIQKDVPLDYNEYVQNYIDIYTSSGRRADIGRMLGLAKYYFPIYEKAFREAGIPEEIKYLSIVESELNPNAVSRVGATGPWQFMYATGKLYGLNIDSYVDERRDPIQASYAAAAYIRDAYQEFGDWLLAIASYNCGKSSVERAIDRAGALDFWSIRQYLPTETRNYVPAYIAVSYIMNYYKNYNVTPQACPFALKTDTVIVNKMVSLKDMARVLDVDAKQLCLLNPAYTRGIINATPANPRRMVLPLVTSDKYTSLFNALNNDIAVTRTPVIYASARNESHESRLPKYHVVRRGETLAHIADVYGVEVQDLKTWNNLRSNRATVGIKLKVNDTADSNGG